MDRNDIALFVRVVEAGTFTAAAATLGMPKSSVSRGVARLEDDVGVALLRRTTRAVTLTDAGHAYYERVKGAIAALDEAAALAGHAERDPKGDVRVTAPVDLGVVVLAPLLSHFVRTHPGLRVETVLTSRRVDLVQEGVDIAVRAGARLTDSTLVARKVASSDLGIFASKAYLDRAGRPKKLADLARHECVLFRASGGHAVWKLHGPKGEERVHVSGSLSADDLTFVRRAVAEGAGIGVFQTFSIGPERASRELVRVLPEYEVRDAALYVVTPATKYLPARVRLLRDFLVAELAKQSVRRTAPCLPR